LPFRADGGAFNRGGERIAAWKIADIGTSSHDPDPWSATQIECHDPRAREVFGVVEPPLALDRIQKVAIPLGLVAPGAVGRTDDCRRVRVRFPRQVPAFPPRREVERRVFVLHAVVVATREKGPDVQHGSGDGS
jgi:hypothetical protein